MGVVYKARDTRLNRTVALKFLVPGLDVSSAAKERFLQEAQTASSLDHPNICTIYEADETPDGQLYIAMPFYDGGTLADKLVHGPLPFTEAVRIALQIARGLAAAHESGITHRDIKPANIIVTNRGEAKLLDFGIAKLVGEAGKTQPGTIVGTPAYMSPEQARGERIDHRTDVWALGVVLYEMVAGRPPFRGSQPHEVLLALTLDPPPSLRSLRREIPAALDRIVGRALAKQPAKRYDDVRSLISDLERLAGTGSAVAVHPETVRLDKPMDSTALELPSPYRGHRPGWLKRAPHARTLAAASAILLLFFTALGYYGWLAKKSEDAGQPTTAKLEERKRILVLPFENLGPSEDTYFSAGVTEEIVSRLVGIRQLDVVAYTASAAGKDLRQLGTELGVDYVLEGKVRWQRSSANLSRVRITPRLIHAADGSHVWSARYEEVIDEIFRVQSDVAEQVIRELDVRLLQPERQRLFARSTTSTEAYQLYLKGRHHQQAADAAERTVHTAQRSYEQAVAIDPDFAQAHARLSQVHSFAFHMALDRTPARLEKAWKSAQKALSLKPDLPEAHLALAYYHYWGKRSYDLALRELEMVAQVQPNSVEVLEARGYIRRRQGNYLSALEDFRKAFALAPENADLAYAIATTYTSLKDFAKAEEYFDQAISLSPHAVYPYVWKAISRVAGKGDVEGAKRVLDSSPDQEDSFFILHRLLFDLYSRDYERALSRIEGADKKFRVQDLLYPQPLLRAYLQTLLGRRDQAATSWEEARLLLEEEIRRNPGDSMNHSSLGVAYAGLGRKEDAVREGKRALEIESANRDSYNQDTNRINLAWTYVLVGDQDAAISEIESLTRQTSMLTIPLLRVDPRWDPLRKHPRFQKLLETAPGGPQA